MAQQISKRTVLPAKPEFPNINRFFDCGVLVARRFTELLSEIEPAILRLFLLLHLIVHLGVIFLAVLILGVVLVWTLGHSS